MQTQEVLFEQDMNAWEYYAYRAASTGTEALQLMQGTRRNIALTYIHKLVS